MHRMYSLSLAAFTLGVTISATLPVVAAPNQPARKSVAMNHKTMARTPAVATRIAVLRFAGPTKIDIDADEVWKVKNKTSAPGQGELSLLTQPLQKALTKQLQSQLGATVVPEGELQAALSREAPSVGSPQISPRLAQKMGVKYYVTGTVDKISFDGNTVLPDHYVMVISTRLIDASSGRDVWSDPADKFSKKTYTKKGDTSVVATFTSAQIPDVAQALASKIASAVGR